MSEKSDWEKGYDQAMMRTYGERKALKARIAELEAERRWIPVGERLPEEKQNVLALDKTGTAYHWEYSRSLSNIFVGYYTHWMPLPKPPEVEK